MPRRSHVVTSPSPFALALQDLSRQVPVIVVLVVVVVSVGVMAAVKDAAHPAVPGGVAPAGSSDVVCLSPATPSEVAAARAVAGNAGNAGRDTRASGSGRTCWSVTSPLP